MLQLPTLAALVAVFFAMLCAVAALNLPARTDAITAADLKDAEWGQLIIPKGTTVELHKIRCVWQGHVVKHPSCVDFGPADQGSDE